MLQVAAHKKCTRTARMSVMSLNRATVVRKDVGVGQPHSCTLPELPA
jgi:hypothetical protein